METEWGIELKRLLYIALSFLCLMTGLAGTISISHAFGEDGESKVPSETAPVVSKILIEIQDLPGDAAPCAEMARNLIFVAEGDRFSPVRLQESIEALKACNRFQEIHVDSREEQGAITLVFHLSVFRLIKEIE